MKGEPVGWVREWHPKSGWKTVPGTEKFSTERRDRVRGRPPCFRCRLHGHVHLQGHARRHESGGGFRQGCRAPGQHPLVGRWVVHTHRQPHRGPGKVRSRADRRLADRRQHLYDLQCHAHGSGQHEGRDRYAQRALWRIRRRNHRDRGRQSALAGQLQVGSGRDLRPQSGENSQACLRSDRPLPSFTAAAVNQVIRRIGLYRQ